MDGLSGLYLPPQKPLSQTGGQKLLSNPNLSAVSGEIQQAIQSLSAQGDASRVLLVIDQLDLVLATGGAQSGAVEVGEMLLGLREVCDLVEYFCCRKQLIILARSRNSLSFVIRQSSGIKSTDTLGIRSWSNVIRYSTPGRFHHEFKAIGFRHG